MDVLIVVLLFTPYFAFASTRAVNALRRFNNRRIYGVMLAATLLIPYLLAASPAARSNPTEFLGDLGRMLAYIFIPTLILLYRPSQRNPLDILDVVVILALWFPIEFDWLPGISAQLAPGLNLPVAKLTGVDLAFLLFLVIRPVGDIGYSYRFKRGDISAALFALLGFALFGLPLGFAIRFIGFGLAPFDLVDWSLKLLAIYLLIAVPEELLFRGLIQNLVEKRFGRNWWTLLISAVIFGAAHLDNATTGYPVPNFAYMLMATLAGLAYGWAWRKSGKITSAAITHALVDWIWGVILLG